MTFRSLGLIAVVTLGTARPVAAQTNDAARVIGCAADFGGNALPGTTIRLDNGRNDRIANTDSKGCYEIPNVVPGLYTASARLQGFYSVMRDVTLVRGQVERIDFRTTVGMCHEETQLADEWPLLDLWKTSDAVARVRTDSHRPDTSYASIYAAVKHTAAVVRVYKAGDDVPVNASSLSFVQFVQRGEEPYETGAEVLVFLAWDRAQQLFVRLHDFQCYPGAFAVTDGVIRSGIREYIGKPVEELVDALRASAAR